MKDEGVKMKLMSSVGEMERDYRIQPQPSSVRRLSYQAYPLQLFKVYGLRLIRVSSRFAA